MYFCSVLEFHPAQPKRPKEESKHLRRGPAPPTIDTIKFRADPSGQTFIPAIRFAYRSSLIIFSPSFFCIHILYSFLLPAHTLGLDYSPYKIFENAPRFSASESLRNSLRCLPRSPPVSPPSWKQGLQDLHSESKLCF